VRTDQRIGTVRRDGLVFDVVDEGPLDGEPVVLLHGWPERATSWREVTPVLNAAGFRTLVPDRRGFSPGARPKRRRDYTLPKLVDDVVALIDEIGGPVHLVGHDWGAVVAWTVAGHHPDRVRTLTAVSVAHPAAFVKAMVRSDQARKSWYMGLFQLPVLPELVVTRRAAWFDLQLLKGGMSKDDVARFRREIVEDGALGTSIGCYRAVPLTDPGVTRFRVAAPTTMVWSDRDVALGRWGAEHSADWCDGDFELVVLEGLSHWIPTEAPEVLAETILERIVG
jgi:pimeloyl-ACP methyl ester carboxylesterase